MTEVNYGAVFYTDGGARPNPGNAGWGIHGYTYEIDKKVSNPGKHNCPTTVGYIELFSGKETPVKIVEYIDGFGTLTGTNNLAEIVAFKKLLELVKERKYKKVSVHLDSAYVLKAITENWYEKWKGNNWKTSSGQDVSNLDLWHDVFELYNEVSKCTELTLSKIKGHIGLIGNSRADELATCGVFASANGHDYEEIIFSPVKGYNNPTAQFNSLFTRNRWYFISGQTEPERLGDDYLYLTGYHGQKVNKKADDDKDEDEESDTALPDSINFGVSQPDTYYGLVCCKQPEPLIDKMQQAHAKMCPTQYELLVVGHLGTILTSKHYNKLLKYGGMFLNKNPIRNQLDLPDGSMVTWEISPQRRSFVVHEVKEYLKDLLLQYRHNQLTCTDLTDCVYESVEKGKKKVTLEYRVREDFPNTARYLDVEANVTYKDELKKIPLRLTLNIDLPVRNHLQRLTEGGTVKPTVTLITWSEGPKAFRYGVVVERNDEQLLWVGTDCNLRIIRDAK